MSFSVTGVLDDGLERLADERLLPAFLTLYAVHLGIVVGTQSQLEAQREDLASEALFGEALLPEQFPLALEVSLGVAWLVWFVALILFVTASMAAFRTLVACGRGRERENVDEDEDVSADGGSVDVSSESNAESESVDTGLDSERNSLLRATLHGLAAAIIGIVVVSTGLLLLVVPGLFLASALAFTHPYIALERVSAIDAMKRSFDVTEGYRLRVFAVLVVIVLTFLAISFLGGFAILLFDVLALSVVGELLNVGFSALAWLAALAILASAFERLESVRAEKEAKWDGIDEELLP